MQKGRIYTKGDPIGYTISETVGPSHPDFSNLIEEGIKPVVYGFLRKGYMPISSCEGHKPTDSTFIHVAMPMIDWVELMHKIKNFKGIRYTVTYEDAGSYMESMHDEWKPEYNEIPKSRLKGLAMRKSMGDEQASECINRLFGKGHKRYTVVKIEIFKGIKTDWDIEWLLKPVRKRNVRKFCKFVEKHLPQAVM